LPDVLIAPDGASIAVRTAGGRLAMLRTGSDSFAIQQWLAADADARSAKDKELAVGLRCDDAGCIGRLADGAIVAIARRPEAFEEDCRRAAVGGEHSHGATRLRRPRYRSCSVATRRRDRAASCRERVGDHRGPLVRPQSALGAPTAHGGGGASISGTPTSRATRCDAES
jgi:competence protein ComEC